MKTYTGKKTFDVEHEPTQGAIKVEIDFDYVFDFGGKQTSMIDALKMMNEFFTDSESRLEDADGDVVIAYLKMLCHKCIGMSIEHYKNCQGIIRLFNDGEEGYSKIDGSQGIKLIDLETPNFGDNSDYKVIEA